MLRVVDQGTSEMEKQRSKDPACGKRLRWCDGRKHGAMYSQPSVSNWTTCRREGWMETWELLISCWPSRRQKNCDPVRFIHPPSAETTTCANVNSWISNQPKDVWQHGLASRFDRLRLGLQVCHDHCIQASTLWTCYRCPLSKLASLLPISSHLDTMSLPKYQPVFEDDEKYHIDTTSHGRSSSSLTEATLLCDESCGRKMAPASKWIWVLHAVLLSVSSMMFAATYFKPVSTLEHVRQFSAYCWSTSRQSWITTNEH